MNWKSLLLVSVAGAVALAPSLAWAQDAQEAPKPDEATAQSASPTAPADATQDSTDTTGGDDIVVTGLRRSLESAQNIKRTSDGIVDAVVAEDIGKLPDTFASSALQRIPGVGVTRGGGEAAGVTVRGLPDLTTTYNGRQIFTAEGRYVAIQDFPAGTVAALEVYKSGLANQIEGGIAGEVNVRGRKPFDFGGFELSGSLNGVLSQQSEGIVPNGNLLVSDRWDTGIGEMGLLVNASYVGIDFLDSSREQSVVIATTDAGNAPGEQAGLRFPDAQGNFLGYGKRWRPSVNAAFQWKPTSELEIYADGLFQGFRSEDYNRWMFIPIFSGPTPLQLSNITVIPGTNQVASATVNGANRPDGYTGSFNGHTDTYQGGGGAIWTHDKLQISADVAYTDSKYTADLVNVDYLLNASPTRLVEFNNPHDGGPTQTFVNYNIADPANMLSRGLYQEKRAVFGKDWQARADVSYEMDMGPLKRVQAGVRYEDRKAGGDFGSSYFNNEGLRIPLTSIPGGDTVGVSLPGFTFNDVQPNVAYAAISRDGIRDNLPELRTFFGAPAGTVAFDPLQNFRGFEKSYAAYAQLKYGFDVGDIVVDGLLGLRAVKTKTRMEGFVLDTGAYNPITVNSDYTDYLPNASARIAFNDKLQLRLAYTQTRTRPNFYDLRPTINLGPPANPGANCIANPTLPECADAFRRGGSGGNPYLTPLTSDNYDISLEYYFSRTGSFTAALFRHDAQGFVFNSTTRFEDPTLGPLIVGAPVNLGKTRLQGAEVAFTSFLDFDFLPDWAKGFGVQANGTYIDAKGDLPPDIYPAYNNEPQLFTGVSKWAYNLIALYEKPQFSARIAYNYRSDFVSTQPGQGYQTETFDPFPHPSFEKGRGQLDGSLSVTPVPNITVAFDVANILGNPLQRFRSYNTDGDAYYRQIVYIERSYSLGVRFRF